MMNYHSHPRPNPAVKRTYTSGAHLLTHRASSAPVQAAYLLRYAASRNVTIDIPYVI